MNYLKKLFTATILFVFTTIQAFALTNKNIEVLEKSRNSILEAETKKRNYLRDIYRVNEKIKKISKRKGALQGQVFYLNSKIKRTARDVNNLEKDIDQSKKKIQRQMKLFYKLSGKRAFSEILSIKNFYELKEKMKILSIISKRDYKSLQKYTDSVVQLKNVRKDLEKQVRHFMKSKLEVKKAETKLLVEQRKKAALISGINIQKKNYLQKVKKWRMDKNQKEVSPKMSLLNELIPREYFFEKKGELHSPLDRPVVKKFGLETIFGPTVQLSHKGITFAAAGTTAMDVYSVFSGNVSYAGLLQGYGNVVILDHSDHYYTVYANVNKIIAKVGNKVSEGEKVAEVSGKQQLYFEIRHYAQTEDPLEWLRKSINLKISVNNKKGITR